jgi:hypothetical protein
MHFRVDPSMQKNSLLRMLNVDNNIQAKASQAQAQAQEQATKQLTPLKHSASVVG